MKCFVTQSTTSQSQDANLSWPHPFCVFSPTLFLWLSFKIILAWASSVIRPLFSSSYWSCSRSDNRSLFSGSGEIQPIIKRAQEPTGFTKTRQGQQCINCHTWYYHHHHNYHFFSSCNGAVTPLSLLHEVVILVILTFTTSLLSRCYHFLFTEHETEIQRS